jgi:quercetin dioxygenase-like cupin family protein
VVQGEVLLYVEERNEYFPLSAGDIIVMPEGVSHT